MATKIAKELRQLLPAKTKHFDAKKVMAWMDAYGPQLVIWLDELEEEYEKHSPSEAFAAKATKEYDTYLDDIGKALLPLFERYCEETGGFDYTSSEQHNQFMYLVNFALGGCGIKMQMTPPPKK